MSAVSKVQPILAEGQGHDALVFNKGWCPDWVGSPDKGNYEESFEVAALTTCYGLGMICRHLCCRDWLPCSQVRSVTYQ